MKVTIPILLILLLSSCYKKLEIDGFDEGKWNSFKSQCSEYRLSSVQTLLDNQDVLLEATQNEIESILGQAEEHELYARNQKVFHYRLTLPDSCSDQTTSPKYLSVRFNAIGRASDIQVIFRE